MNPQAIEKRLRLTVDHLKRVRDLRPELLERFKASRQKNDPHGHEAVCRAIIQLPEEKVMIIDSDFGPIAVTTKPYRGTVDDLPTFDPDEVLELHRIGDRETTRAAVLTKREFPGSRVTNPAEVKKKLRRVTP